MQVVKNYNHPLHMVNSYRAIVKRALREFIPCVSTKPDIPSLSQSSSYYFIFESSPKEATNQLCYGITCFDSDGVIVFSHMGVYPVSLWRFRRQGLKRSASMLEGVIKSVFKRKHVPLVSDEPFRILPDNLYQCNISWPCYNTFLNL